MGMNTHILGFREPDDKWRKMKKVYESCYEANIDVPDEVIQFFDGKEPTDLGLDVEIVKSPAVKKVKEEMKDGFIVNIQKLLEYYPTLTHIKFYNSY